MNDRCLIVASFNQKVSDYQFAYKGRYFSLLNVKVITVEYSFVEDTVFLMVSSFEEVNQRAVTPSVLEPLHYLVQIFFLHIDTPCSTPCAKRHFSWGKELVRDRDVVLPYRRFDRRTYDLLDGILILYSFFADNASCVLFLFMI